MVRVSVEVWSNLPEQGTGQFIVKDFDGSIVYYYFDSRVNTTNFTINFSALIFRLENGTPLRKVKHLGMTSRA